MDIKRLRYAVALAEELNFARAAEKLHLSQPALSRSIQTLEEELGLLLFDRDNRNVRLTTVGRDFLAQARPLLFQLRNLEREMALVRGGEIGRVAFGAGPLPTASLLPGMFRALRQSHPGLSFSVSSNNWRYLLQHLRAEDIEFFVADTRDIAPAPDISITPLCRQFGHFSCRAGHPLLSKKKLVPADMKEYGLATLALPATMRALFEKVLGVGPHQPLPVVVECDNMYMLKQIVHEDDLILTATEASVAEDIANGKLVALKFEGMPPLYAEMGIVSLAGRSLSPAALLVHRQLLVVAAGAPGTAMYGAPGYPAPQSHSTPHG